jgi:hypothetical protein
MKKTLKNSDFGLFRTIAPFETSNLTLKLKNFFSSIIFQGNLERFKKIFNHFCLFLEVAISNHDRHAGSRDVRTLIICSARGLK